MPAIFPETVGDDVTSRTAPSPDAVFIRLYPTKTDHTDHEHHPQRQNRTLHKTIQEQVIQWLDEYRPLHSWSNEYSACGTSAGDDKFCQKFYFPVFGFEAMM